MSKIGIPTDFDVFSSALEEAAEKHNVTDEQELKDIVPKQDAQKHGPIASVKLNGLALTTKGNITRTAYFDSIDIKEEFYGNIVLTEEEAKKLAITFKHLTKGVNAMVPLTCTASACPFADSCPLEQMNKAPIGKPCLIEYELLEFNTRQFIEEFDVDMGSHSEVLLVQELAELSVYEMRASRVLAEPQNAKMFGLRLKFSPDGEAIEEEVEHWAWGLKEKIKNRRMKILDALIGTRKSQATVKNKKTDLDEPYYNQVKNVKDIIESLRNNKIKEGEYEEVKEKN